MQAVVLMDVVVQVGLEAGSQVSDAKGSPPAL